MFKGILIEKDEAEVIAPATRTSPRRYCLPGM